MVSFAFFLVFLILVGFVFSGIDLWFGFIFYFMRSVVGVGRGRGCC